MYDASQPTTRGLKRLIGRWAMLIVLAGIAVAWALAARGNQWWAEAIRSRSFVRLGILLMGSALALQWILRVLVELGRRPKARLHSDQRGLAVLEFALVFPIAMCIVLVMVQTAMLMVGNLMVHYAAFCATRSAIVWVPAYVSDTEPRDVVAAEDSSQKLARIRQAAVLALAPAAGAPQNGTYGQSSDSVRSGLASFLAGYGVPSPAWLGNVMGRKLDYATQHTRVEISNAPGSFDEQADITVTVYHDFYLAVPYVARIFGQETADAPGEFSAAIDASYTLVNQGKDDRVKLEYREDDKNELLLPR